MRPKPFPTGLGQALQSLNDFIVHRASEPLWVFGWVLFAASFWFLIGFYRSAPERLTDLDRERAALGERALDATQAGRVYDAVNAAWSSAAEAARFYQINLVGRPASERLPAELLSTGSELTVATRRRIAAATGTLAGIQFTDQQLSTYTEGLRTDFQAADVTLATYERFFKSYASGDVGDAVSLLGAADADIVGAEREAATTMMRAKFWSERADALINQLVTDSSALNAKRRTFNLELYATIPALLYGVCFLVFAVVVWFRTKARRNRRSRTNEDRMTKQPQTDAHATQVSAETERALHDFVRAAVSRLSATLKDQAPEWEIDLRWQRGVDGQFREYSKRTRKLWSILNDEWLRSLPDYDTCVKDLKSDPVIGPHLERLVGTRTGDSIRIEATTILQSAIYGMLNDDGTFAFTEERFDRKWRNFAEFFGADRIAFKTIALLPYLVIPDFPLRLNDELFLDRLTEDEVTRSCQVGVLRPPSERFPMLSDEVAVGIRKTTFLPKLILTGDEAHEVPDVTDEGNFGNRPPWRADLVVDDILSLLRLFKHAHVQTAGHATWTDSLWLNAGTSYRVLRQWPYGGKYQLSPSEVPQFLELWHLLEKGAARFGFSIHRFNLAFDRGLLADRIVDLVIAAEALFLSDLDDKYRGELRFRFALRAAKFIENSKYDEHDTFRVMRRAYDVRSAIVHGGSPKDTGLPDNQSAKLPAFTDAIEELVRLGLRKALSMKEDGKKVRQSEYWDTLVFSQSSIRSEHHG